MITPYALLILKKDNSILLLKRSQHASFGAGSYCLVGGKAEEGESMKQAIIREAFEEVDITITDDQLQFVHVFHRKASTDQLVATCFVCTQWSGQVINKEPSKHDFFVWTDMHALPEDMLPAHKAAVKAYLQGNYYLEHGW